MSASSSSSAGKPQQGFTPLPYDQVEKLIQDYQYTEHDEWLASGGASRPQVAQGPAVIAIAGIILRAEESAVKSGKQKSASSSSSSKPLKWYTDRKNQVMVPLSKQ